MKIKSISIKNFKRFTDLKIDGIPKSSKIVILLGPNGSGKTSLFESMNHWHNWKGYYSTSADDYLVKKNAIPLNSKFDKENSINVNFHNYNITNRTDVKGKFYFRTAYRNEADFLINNLNKQNNPLDRVKLNSLNINDITVSENYQRLISKTLAGVYNESYSDRTIKDLREEIIGKIRNSLSNIFDDLNLSSIGDPLLNGSFYFEKGISKDFHYKNLSAGEKSVFDLILDIIIKTEYYANSIMCIDEPEAHMHTRLQGILLKELYNLTPKDSQLWLSTHSFGMINQAIEIEKKNPGTVCFIDFTDKDFDNKIIITPSKPNKALIDKFFEFAIGEFSNLIAPKTIIFCEGTSTGRKYKNFDAQIYQKIFNEKYSDSKFISLGSSSELEKQDNSSVTLISKLLTTSKIIKFIDRDDKSDEEIDELKEKNIKVSAKRNIESYILDNEIITKLCESLNKSEFTNECIKIKNEAIEASISRGNPNDDLKSASGDIFVKLKQILSLTQCGNNKCSFLRDTLTPLITDETEVYKELEKEIFK